jgi:hypothetical protein
VKVKEAVAAALAEPPPRPVSPPMKPIPDPPPPIDPLPEIRDDLRRISDRMREIERSAAAQSQMQPGGAVGLIGQVRAGQAEIARGQAELTRRVAALEGAAPAPPAPEQTVAEDPSAPAQEFAAGDALSTADFPSLAITVEASTANLSGGAWFPDRRGQCHGQPRRRHPGQSRRRARCQQGRRRHPHRGDQREARRAGDRADPGQALI